MSDFLIRCAAHGVSPFHLVCCHLMRRPTQRWNPVVVEDGREVTHDYVCDRCLRGGDTKTLRVICMNCVRHLQQRAGAASGLEGS